jgi:hypothetical protein
MNATDEPQTSYFAPEIEEAAIAILWRQPERLGEFLREIDPAVHITQPHLRKILEAIDLGWRELGAVDFATIVTLVRELNYFEDCGGREGLNELWVAGDRNVATAPNDDVIFAHYVEMLKTYALARKSDGKFPCARFTGGSGELFPNKTKRRDSDPDFLGEIKIAGKLYRVAAWFVADRSAIQIRCLPK